MVSKRSKATNSSFICQCFYKSNHLSLFFIFVLLLHYNLKLMFRKNKRIVLIFLIFGFVAVQSLTAQDVPFKSKLWMEGKVHYGFVIPHHDYMVHLTSQHL